MTPQQTLRWACSLYVDLRLGVVGGECRTREQAQRTVSREYGYHLAKLAASTVEGDE